MAQTPRSASRRRWLVIGVVAAVLVVGLLAVAAYAGDGSGGTFGYALIALPAEAARSIRRLLRFPIRR